MLAAHHGLAVHGITTVEPMPDIREILLGHLQAGHLSGLDWFDEERARVSVDATNLMPNARSIIAFALPYWSGPAEKPDDGVIRGRISRYAWGKDYHRVLKRRMKALRAAMEEMLGEALEVRMLVDTARIVERAVAARAGVGWFGKNANLIVPGHGSWVLLGEMLTDLSLVSDHPLPNHCGNCRFCLDDCPTGALVNQYEVHAPACISYLTIEERGSIPRELRPKMGDWVYGCDVCQDVCPYTRAAQMVNEPELRPASINNAYPSLHWLLTMRREEYEATYFGTAVPRAKAWGLARNACIALGNIGSAADVPVLEETLAGYGHELVRGHAAWALGRIGGQRGLAAVERAWRSDPAAFVRAECAAVLNEAD